MNEPTIDIMVKRLDRLERANRRLKLSGVIVLFLIGALVLMGQAKPSKVAKVVEAEHFILKDTEGNKRAELVPDMNGAALRMYDRDRLRISMSAHASIQQLEFLGDNNSPSMSLGSNGGTTYLFLTPTLSSRASISLMAGFANTSSMTFQDGDGKRRAWIIASSLGTEITLYDKDFKPRAVIGVTTLENPRTGVKEQRPSSSLVLFDKDGKVIWKAP